MKKRIIGFASAFVLLLSIFLIGIGSDSGLKVQGALSRLNKTKLMLLQGQTFNLELSNSASNVVWSSSDTAVAKVSSKGKVTAYNEGSATIKVKSGLFTYSCKVVVKPLSIATYLVVGQSTSLTMPIKTKTVTWATSDTSVATVNSNGLVTAEGIGTVQITGKIDKTLYESYIIVENPKLSKSKISLNKGQNTILTLSGTNQNVTWGTEKSSVATVTSKGKVIAQNDGTTRIYAKIGTKKIYCTVQVGENILRIGTNAEFSPFEYIDKKNGIINNFAGIDIEIINSISNSNSFKPIISDMDFDSLLIALNNNKLDCVISGMEKTSQRAKSVSFSKSYFVATNVLIINKDMKSLSVSEIESKTIGVVKNSSAYYEAKEQGLKCKTYKNLSSCISALQKGYVTAVVTSQSVAEALLSNNNDLLIVQDSKTFASSEYSIAVQKNAKELLSKINTSIDKLKENGELNKIILKYFQ